MLLEGLEVSIISYSKLNSGAETKRSDPEYYQKQFLQDEVTVAKKSKQFSNFPEMGLRVDASAFYPAIKQYYGAGDLPFLRVPDADSTIDFEGCTKIPAELCDRFPTLKKVRNGDHYCPK